MAKWKFLCHMYPLWPPVKCWCVMYVLVFLVCCFHEFCCYHLYSCISSMSFFALVFSTATWTLGKKIYFATVISWQCVVFFHHILTCFIPLFELNLSIFHITCVRGLFCMTSRLLWWRSNWRAIISCCSLQGVHWLIAKIWICVTDVPTRSALNSDSYITRR